MGKVYVGIDNGVSGGVAAIDAETNKIIYTGLVPTFKLGDNTLIDEFKLSDLVKQWDPRFVIIERPAVNYKFTTKTAFSSGMSFRAVITAMTLSLSPYEFVTPKKWQNFMYRGSVPGAGSLDKEKDTKELSIQLTKMLFPGVNLHKSERSYTDNDNISDAILMAEYARRKGL